MSKIECSVHFITLKQVGYEESNVAVTSYHDRTHFESNQKSAYSIYAEDFNLQQGRQFILHNKLATIPTKISKFKDQIKELDEIFSSHQADNTPNLNHFLSCHNSNIAKIIWLTTNRLVLIMKNSLLIWIVFDTLSGDLIKISIDKTLTNGIQILNNQASSSTSAAKQSHLSGKVICDAFLIVRKEKVGSSCLILVFSDSAIVDIITFNKNSNLIDYLQEWKSDQLKKLKDFEPCLRKFEFSVPNQYLIEKRISYNNSSLNDLNSTLTIWWENYGLSNTIKMDKLYENKSISLLDRDDLKNNILVLSLNFQFDNLLEYLFKSDGNLLSVSYLNKNSLIALEQKELNNTPKTYSINIYRYDLPNESAMETKSSLKIKLAQLNLNSKIFSNEQVRTCSNYILMLSADQTLIIYEINRNLYRLFSLNKEDDQYNGIEWMIDDLIFCVYNVNGDIILFDIGFNQIDMNYMTREYNKFKSLSYYLNQNIFSRFNSKKKTNGKNSFQRIVSSRSIFTESLWSFIYFTNGPLGLFRLSLTDNFNCVSLTNHYLKNTLLQHDLHLEYLINAVDLYIELDWDRQSRLALSCLHKILNFILSDQIVFNSKIEKLGSKSLSSFYKPKKQLNEKTIYENKNQVSRLARRFFFKLLTSKSFYSAYLLAIDIGSKDLFNDLFFCCVDWNENQIAELSRCKYQELVDKEVNNKKELNRSFNKTYETDQNSDDESSGSNYSSNDFLYILPEQSKINENEFLRVQNIYNVEEIAEFEKKLLQIVKF